MLHNISRSLEDMLGKSYMDTVQETAVTLLGMDPAEAKALATDKVDFYSDEFAARCDALAAKVGQQVVKPYNGDLVGAPTESFRNATHVNAAPIGGLGTVRVLETDELWHGVTYKEDLDAVKAAIGQMRDSGFYPKNLWTAE